MKKTSEPIVFFGNEQLATGVTTSAPLLSRLVELGYNIKYLVLNVGPKGLPSSKQSTVLEIARLHNIEVLSPDKIIDIEPRLISARPRIGILAAYGQIIPAGILDIFPLGIINLHPSLLPLHRGPTPIESVILNGEQKTGASIMRLGEKMDAGPIFARSELVLSGNETKQELSDSLGEIGSAMTVEILDNILDETLVAVPQDESQATFDKLITKADGKIDWRKPAEQIEREVRAYAGWPGSYSRLGSTEVIVEACKLIGVNSKPGEININDKKLFVGCGVGSIEITRLKPSGKKSMSAGDFLLGYVSRLI